jgi:uncharacterized protein (DUF2267 family)
VKALDFISDEGKADAAAKAVLGIMASNMKETEEKDLVEKLPSPLNGEINGWLVTYGKSGDH